METLVQDIRFGPLIMQQGTRLALAGVVIGIVGSLRMTQLMASLLFGVSAREWATFSVVPSVVLAMIMVGRYSPGPTGGQTRSGGRVETALI
jgi:uncharacterized membrane protein YeaQ/YmgE (transglycosylase-associated protein family)